MPSVVIGSSFFGFSLSAALAESLASHHAANMHMWFLPWDLPLLSSQLADMLNRRKLAESTGEIRIKVIFEKVNLRCVVSIWSLSQCQNPCCSWDVYSVQYPCLTSQICHFISSWSVQTCCDSRTPDKIHGYNSDALLWDQADLSSSSASLIAFAEKQVPI